MIKLEGAEGDPMRHAFGGDAGSAKVMEGKESLSIDMKSPEGRKIVHELIARADVFVLGFRPGVAERLGIDYDTLSKINPKLVYVHAAGYGAKVRTVTDRCTRAPRSRLPATCRVSQRSGWIPSSQPTSASSSCKR